MGAGGNHPVEVVGRIREHPEAKQQQQQQALTINPSSLRVRTEQGYRDFVLDGVSDSANEALPAFYSKYVQARVEDVRSGGRCTIMMYGPTGAGKSHTMFGSVREPGVAYLALRQIMSGNGVQVSANVLEVYNEDVYDLLAACTSTPISSPGPKSLKGGASFARPKLEVRGKKVRNAVSICSSDPNKLVQEIAKVEKRRVVKSTNSNDRSSRSHCMVVLEILGVGGRLVLVDMAGSENSDQAGSGVEAKLQTGKINQGNSALKRVVECIANGNPYIPYRDSKLTMLLQDSFEDDGSKILMVLCASPDPRDVYKTICTLEYGAKAKCIVRLPSSPPKYGNGGSGTEAMLQARLQFKDECLEKLRLEYEIKARDHESEMEKLAERERELSALRSALEKVEAECSLKMASFQREMDRVMEEKSRQLKQELELEIRAAAAKASSSSSTSSPGIDEDRLVELGRVIEKQKQEIEVLRLRAERAEAELLLLQKMNRAVHTSSKEEEQGLLRLESKQLNQVSAVESLNSWARNTSPPSSPPGEFSPAPSRLREEEEMMMTPPSACKNLELEFKFSCSPEEKKSREEAEDQRGSSPAGTGTRVSPVAAAARKARIENIFLLCGDNRERIKSSANSPRGTGATPSPLRSLENILPTTPPSSSSSGKKQLRKPSSSAIRRGENFAPAQLVA